MARRRSTVRAAIGRRRRLPRRVGMWRGDDGWRRTAPATTVTTAGRAGAAEASRVRLRSARVGVLVALGLGMSPDVTAAMSAAAERNDAMRSSDAPSPTPWSRSEEPSVSPGATWSSCPHPWRGLASSRDRRRSTDVMRAGVSPDPLSQLSSRVGESGVGGPGACDSEASCRHSSVEMPPTKGSRTAPTRAERCAPVKTALSRPVSWFMGNPPGETGIAPVEAASLTSHPSLRLRPSHLAGPGPGAAAIGAPRAHLALPGAPGRGEGVPVPIARHRSRMRARPRAPGRRAGNIVLHRACAERHRNGFVPAAIPAPTLLLGAGAAGAQQAIASTFRGTTTFAGPRRIDVRVSLS